MTSKLRISIVLIVSQVLLLGMPLHSQTKKIANTLLWEISGKQLKKPSYLFGTMHVSKKSAFHLQDSVLIAMSNVDFVGLELNPETWLRDMCNSQLFDEMLKLQSGSLPGDFYDQVTGITPPGEYELRAALLDNENLVNTLLYRFGAGADNNKYEEVTYLDLFIYQLGKKLKKKTVGLEDFETSLEMAFRGSIPDDEELDALEDKYSDYTNKYSTVQEIEKAYRNWNLNDLDSLIKLTYLTKNFEKYVIIKRNKMMIEHMDSLMHLGSVFCGVGAAHLPGNEGMLNLLDSLGYTVRPVLGKETFSGRKKTDKTHSKIMSREVKTYSLPDKSITYTLPGELLKIPTGNEHEFLLYPDMVNGSYYVIYRIQHYSRLMGKTEREIALSIDSILYENTPGKIISKKEIVSNAGYPGQEITTKLPNGHFMQIQLYFTPLEVVVCKAGGKQDAYKSNEWKKFFSTLKFAQTGNVADAWETIESNKYGYSTKLPALRSDYEFPNTYSYNFRTQAFSRSDSTYYMLSANTLNDYDYVESDTFELNYLTDRIAKNLKAEKISYTSSNKESVASYKFIGNDNYLHSKVVMQGNRFYILLSAGRDSLPNSKFFDSFSIAGDLTEFKALPLVDSSMFFSTVSDVPEWDEIAKFKGLLEGAAQVYQRSKYAPRAMAKVYYAHNQPAAIEVHRLKINKYFSVKELSDAFMGNSFQRNTFHKNFIRASGSYYSKPEMNEDSTYSCTYIIADSASTRGVFVKELIYNDHIYTLSTVIDTAIGLSSWQKNFYNNFQAWDTCPKFDIMARKDDMFYHDIVEDDSLAFDDMNYTTESSLMRDNDEFVKRILELAKGDFYSTLKMEGKINFIELIAYSDSNLKECVDVLKKYYKLAEDTIDIQIAVLRALSWYEDEASYKAIPELLSYNLPLPESEYRLNGFFNNLDDTLELCSYLFPSLLEYVTIPEYKDNVIKLMAKMAQNGLLKGDMWMQHKNTLLRDAQLEWKRYRADKSEESDGEPILNGDDLYDYDLPWENSNTKDRVASYALIFATQYENDRKLKEFVDDLMNTKDKEFVFSSVHSLEKYFNYNTDTTWRWMASDKLAQMYFLDWLEALERDNEFPSDLYSQEDMARCWLTSIPRTDEKKDSIQLMRKIRVYDGKDDGYVFFFKYKDLEDKEWKMNYVGLQPADSNVMESDFNHYESDGTKLNDLDEDEIEKQIREVLREIRVENRRRVRTRSSYLNNYDWGY